MKKKLSLLLLVLLLMTLVPISSFATVEVGSIAAKEVTTETNDMKYQITFGDNKAILKADTLFELNLDNGANVTDITMTSGSEVIKGYGGTVKITNEFAEAFNGKAANHTIICDFTADFTDAEIGKSIVLTIGGTNGIGEISKTIAKVMSPYIEDTLQIEVNNPDVKVSELGGKLGSFTIKQLINVKGDIIIKLDNEAKFNYDGSSKTRVYVGGIEYKGVGLRTDSITLKYGKDFDSKTQAILVEPNVRTINSEIDVINAMVETSSTETGDFTTSAKIGEVTAYSVGVIVKENGEKTIPSLIGGQKATLKVTIEGTKGSITPARDYNITLKGATVMKVTPTTKIGIDKFVFDETTDNRVSNFRIVPSSDTKMEFITDFYVAADAKDGIATMTVSSRDMSENITVDIIEIGEAYSVNSAITKIKAKDAASTSDITIKESKAGQFKTGMYLYVIFDDKLSFSEKPQIEGTNHIMFGDITWVKDLKGNNVGVAIKISSQSSKMSEITISKMVTEMAHNGLNGRNYGAKLLVGSTLVNKYEDILENKTIVEFAEFDYAQCISGDNQIIFTLNSATYTVGGTAKALEAPVFTKDNRTMLPIGPLALAMGLEVDYNAGAKEATFKDTIKGTTVTVKEGASTLVINGSEKLMLTTATTVNGRIFVPVASITDAFGANIAWDADTKEVTIN